jgi:large subunit ribosomal protein L29
MALDTKDLREQTVEELEKREQELSDQLFALRFQKLTGQLEKPSKVREVKRDRALLQTVLTEKKRA